MIDRHPIRTEIQIQDEMDEIFRLQVAGATPKQIMKLRNLPERTYYDYNKRLMDRIVTAETNKRTEEVLVQKEICKERMVDSMQTEYKLSHDDKISPRTRMDAAQRRAEIAAALFKIDIETTNWLLAYRNMKLEEPIQLEDNRPVADPSPDPDALADARATPDPTPTNFDDDTEQEDEQQ
jgi:hypothetical protein